MLSRVSSLAPRSFYRPVSTMRAVTLSGFGAVDVMSVSSVRVPVPKAGEVLVRVAYAGVNGPDLLQVHVPTPPPQASVRYP